MHSPSSCSASRWPVRMETARRWAVNECAHLKHPYAFSLTRRRSFFCSASWRSARRCTFSCVVSRRESRRRRSGIHEARSTEGRAEIMIKHEHDHGKGHGHSHAGIDPSIVSSDRGLWAVKWSFVGLFITAAVQLAIVILSNSISLLADTIHNFG